MDNQTFRLDKNIAAGGMGDIFNVSIINPSSKLAKNADSRKIIAKVMKQAGEKMFVQEVSIMSLFLGHSNVTTIK